MITRLTIKAFKSLTEVSVDLGRVNVFIGANGSGKSNLLEALGVLGAAANGRVDDEALLRRGVRPGVPTLYKSSFTGSRMRPSIRFEATSGEVSYSVELNNPTASPSWGYKNEVLKEGNRKIVGRSPNSLDYYDPERGLAALRAVEARAEDPVAYKLLDALSGYAIYSPNTNTLRGLLTDPQQREPVGLSGGRLANGVRELLQARRGSPKMQDVCDKINELIDWSTKVSCRSGNGNLPLSSSVTTAKDVLVFRDRFMAEKRNELTAYDASEGALYVLFASLLATMESAPRVLAIDNVDHGLNPRLARALMAQLCEWVVERNEKQVLLTTHNPLVLDGLPLDNDDVRLFAVGRSRKGVTTVNRIQLDTDALQRDGELWTVSRLWVMGHLGGVPDV